jgi:hypothetical protein
MAIVVGKGLERRALADPGSFVEEVGVEAAVETATGAGCLDGIEYVAKCVVEQPILIDH